MVLGDGLGVPVRLCEIVRERLGWIDTFIVKVLQTIESLAITKWCVVRLIQPKPLPF